MKVSDNCSKPGRIWSIEVSGIGRRELVGMVAAIPGVHIIRKPHLFSWLSDEPFCRFELNGRQFTIEAVWPAGQCFEIGPDPHGCADEMLAVRQGLLKHGA